MWIMVTVFGIVGSYVPVFFGVSAFSELSLFCGLVGSLLGLWLSFKLLGY
jgi:hypothetical protein